MCTETFSVGNFTCTYQRLKVSQTYRRSKKPGYIRGDLEGGGRALTQDPARGGGGEGKVIYNVNPLTLLASVASFKVYSCFSLQTFCGRRVEIESTPLDIARTITSATTADEEKKTLVVAVSERKDKGDVLS